jgi:hypothetical protein
VLVNASLRLIDELLDGTLEPAAHRSPFTLIPFFRTNFWRAGAVGAAAGIAAFSAVAWHRRQRRAT